MPAGSPSQKVSSATTAARGISHPLAVRTVRNGGEIDQIQDAMTIDAQASGSSLDVEGIAEFRLKRLDKIAKHKAHRAAVATSRVQTAFENPFLHEPRNGSLPRAKHFGRLSLGNPRTMAKSRAILGPLKPTDLPAQNGRPHNAPEILSQGDSGRRMSQFLQLGSLGRQRVNRRPTPVDVVLCLSIC